MITISICVTDIPKESIILNKNGKKYLNLVLVDKKQPDNFGNDIGVCISQSKEERDTKKPSVWVGNGKNRNKQQAPQNTQSSPTPNTPPANTSWTVPGQVDDLPF